MTTRIFNALLAIWLFVTAFMWPHGHHQFAITIIAAVLTFVLAIFEIYSGAARYLNVVVAIFLFPDGHHDSGAARDDLEQRHRRHRHLRLGAG